MIRINLLGEKVDKSGIYALQILSYIVACAVVSFSCLVLYTSTNETVENLEREKQALEHRLTSLRKQTKQVEDLESKRKLLREKLNTIATLKVSKQEPVKLLDGIARSVPEKVWLTKLEEQSGYLTITGVALDNQTVSLFMNNLEQLELIADVKLIVSEMFIKDDVQLKQFSLSLQTARKAKELKKAEEEAAKTAATAKPVPAKKNKKAKKVGE